MTQLNEMLDSPAPSLSPSSVSPGLVCCAASSIDDQWHRVVVLEPGADSAHVSAGKHTSLSLAAHDTLQCQCRIFVVFFVVPYFNTTGFVPFCCLLKVMLSVVVMVV